MVHKRVAISHRITAEIVEAGRIIHVKAYGQVGCINIIGFYQQAWDPTRLRIQECLAKRSHLLRKLEGVLKECSCNQTLVLGGDFTCPEPKTH